ncbi:type II toxin-antitoxin system VapC family toxin [soil metagenome]
MRIPDVNVLLYASDASSSHHSTARAWVERTLSVTETVGFAIVVVLGFVRITTNPRIVANPITPSDAFEVIAEWLAQPPATVLHPGRRHLGVCRELLEAEGTAGNLTTDAHLAALAIEHGATLASFDGDFHRFRGLQLEYLH